MNDFPLVVQFACWAGIGIGAWIGIGLLFGVAWLVLAALGSALIGGSVIGIFTDKDGRRTALQYAGLAAALGPFASIGMPLALADI